MKHSHIYSDKRKSARLTSNCIQSQVRGKMMKSFLANCLPFAVLFFLFAACTFADPTDQSFTSGNNAQTYINGCCAFVGQTYTAGLTGTLAGVSVDISEFAGDNLPLDVQIRSTTGGLPTTTILGETSTRAFSLADVVTFSQAIPQAAGVEYAIVVDFLGAPPPPGPGVGIWTGGTGNGYPQGNDVLSFDGGVTWSATFPNNADSHFVTFVNTVPEPGSALLLFSGMLTLGVRFRRGFSRREKR